MVLNADVLQYPRISLRLSRSKFVIEAEHSGSYRMKHGKSEWPEGCWVYPRPQCSTQGVYFQNPRYISG